MNIQFKWFGLISLFVFVLIGSETVTAQTEKPQSGFKKAEIMTCEEIKNTLDYSVIDFRKLERTYLIFVFRAGSGENSKYVNQKRTEFVKKYLRLRTSEFQRIVFTKGENVKGAGRIEIYLGGRLESIIQLEKKKVGLDSCVE